MIMIKSVPLVLFVFKNTDQEQKRIQPVLPLPVYTDKEHLNSKTHCE